MRRTLKRFGMPLLAAVFAGCGGADDPDGTASHDGPRQALAAGSQIAVVARGSLAGNWGPVMEVRANGQWLGRVEVRSAQDQTYSFSTSAPLPRDRKIEVSFVNDAVAGGEDRNLYVRSVAVDGQQVASGAEGVRYLRGWDEIPGQEAMFWNGTLRFAFTRDTAPAHTFSWQAENVWHETFEAPAALGDWRFNAGAEFGPGARGGLALVPGQSGGKAMELSYSTVDCDARGCPVYAAARHALKRPVQADTLRLRIRNALPREARVYALVKDGSAQTLQYRPERCPFETADDDWCTLEVDLRRPSAHWGGAGTGSIQGEITEVSVLVQALEGVRGRTPIQGTLQFDDVVLARAPSLVSLVRAGDAGTATGWRAMDIADNTARLGVAVHFRGGRPENLGRLQMAKEAGFGFVRTDLFWSRVERVAGVYDFSAAEQLLEDARALGLKVLFILDYDNPLHRNGVLMSTDAERRAFASYAAAAAKRFKGRGVRFEIWNEQNSGAVCPWGNEGFWLPRPDARNYGRLVAATMEAVRAVDPAVEVTLGGITPSFTSRCDLDEATQFSFQYIDALHGAGGLGGVDALGYHAYYHHAEAWGAELRMLRTLLREKGRPAMQVWDTEWGVSSACPDGEPCAQGASKFKRDRQAVRLARRMMVGLAMGLPVNVWYDLVDDGVDPGSREHHFGLYDSQLNGKPALAAMRVLANVSRERLTGAFPDLPAGMHALRFRRGGDTVYALWVERGELRLSADTGGLAGAVDVQGNALPATGNWTLHESQGPIYLTYR